MKTIDIRLGHSPDADDAFMFYALAQDKIDTGPYRFTHILEDIQTLNERAERGELEITAISFHAYPYIADKYALLRCGASFGDGYGPMVVASSPMQPDEITQHTIAVPGRLTSAFLGLKLAVGEYPFEVVPFDQIIDRVVAGDFRAGLIIHEGQLTYSHAGLHLVLELGQWWASETALPLPLGGNVIRRDLGPEVMEDLATILQQSVAYGLQHRTDGLEHARSYSRDLDDIQLIDKFVDMYVNEYTLDCGDQGEAAIRLFLDKAKAAGYVPEFGTPEFVTPRKHL